MEDVATGHPKRPLLVVVSRCASLLCAHRSKARPESVRPRADSATLGRLPSAVQLAFGVAERSAVLSQPASRNQADRMLGSVSQCDRLRGSGNRRWLLAIQWLRVSLTWCPGKCAV